MKTAAIRIHELVHSLHIEEARVVGHAIGLMVAYAYAAQFPRPTPQVSVSAKNYGRGSWRPSTGPTGQDTSIVSASR